MSFEGIGLVTSGCAILMESRVGMGDTGVADRCDAEGSVVDDTTDEESALAMGSVMLVAAVMVSLALGVLVAYGVCYGMFQVFRIHSSAVRARAVAVRGVLAER